jgi:hypothetical protein
MRHWRLPKNQMFRGKKNKRDWDFIRETPTSRLIPTQQQYHRVYKSCDGNNN